MKKILALFLGITLCVSSFAQNIISYEDFKNNYNPHNNLLSPENVIVPVMSKMEAEDLAPLFDEFVKSGKQDSKTTFVLLVCSMPRIKVGNTLDLMTNHLLVKGINFLKDEWALDVIYYLSESTYNNSSAELNALKTYTKSEKLISNNLSFSDISSTSSPINLSDFFQLGWYVAGNVLAQGKNEQVKGFLEESISKLGIPNMTTYDFNEINVMSNWVELKYNLKAAKVFKLGFLIIDLSSKEGKVLRKSFKNSFKYYYIAIFGEDDYFRELSEKIKQNTFKAESKNIMLELDRRLKKML